MKQIVTFCALVGVLFGLSAVAEQSKPNVVYLMADDLGWSDLSSHPGGGIPTPNLDRLFKQGLQLNNFMGWCVCSPTRAMLLTGRHPFPRRHGAGDGWGIGEGRDDHRRGF
jgi:arylsulfatase A-like enzyme